MLLVGLGFILEGSLRIINHYESNITNKLPHSTPTVNQAEKDPLTVSKNGLYSNPIVSDNSITNDNGDELEEPIIKEYYLQLGTFQYEYFAYRLKNKLKAKGYTVKVTNKKIKGKEMFINSLGPFKSQEIANNHKTKILQLFPDLNYIPIYSKIK